eukprot:1018712-Prymnesium_polylepis.1
MDSDQCVACPTRRLAARVAAGGTAVYSYEFAHLSAPDMAASAGLVRYPPQSNVTASWASHFAEVAFVFGGLYPTAHTDEMRRQEEALHREMLARWVAFAKTGTPSADGAVAWPAASAAGGVRSLRLGVAATGGVYVQAASVKSAQCAALARRVAGPEGDCLN